MLRVKARNRSYWKAANLAVFDGRRWVQPGGTLRSRLDAGLEDLNPKWRQNVRVTMRALRSVQFVAAGSTLAIPDAPRTPVQREYGLYSALERPLRRGNTYRASVYVPDPTPRQMRDAWTRPLPFDAALTEVSAPGARQAQQGVPSRSRRGALASRRRLTRALDRELGLRPHVRARATPAGARGDAV